MCQRTRRSGFGVGVVTSGGTGGLPTRVPQAPATGGEVISTTPPLVGFATLKGSTRNGPYPAHRDERSMPTRSRPDLTSIAEVSAPIPDRPLDPEGDLPTVAVRAAGHHPFVYRKMVDRPRRAGPPARRRPGPGRRPRRPAARLRPLERPVADQPAAARRRRRAARAATSGKAGSTGPSPSAATSSGSTRRPTPTGSSTPRPTASPA